MKVFLSILILYLLIFYFRLDAFDRLCVFYTIRHAWKFEVPTYKITQFFLFFTTPFRSENYLALLSEGAIYQTYVLHFFAEQVRHRNNKFYWFEICKRFQIPHPKVIAVKENNNITVYASIDATKEYFTKPLFGAMAYDTARIKGEDVMSIKNDTIVQEYLCDCIVGYPRHFRITTLYDQSIYAIEMLENSSKNALTSNRIEANSKQQKVKATQCDLFDCDLPYSARQKLQYTTNKLKNLHSSEFSNIFSIGWDVMLHCTAVSTEAYCLEGNVLHAVSRYGTLSKMESYVYYKKECLKFLESTHLVDIQGQ